MSRNKEHEETAAQMRKWIEDAKEILPQLRDSCKQQPDFGATEGAQLAQRFIDEANYFKRCALRFPPDWPEYQDFAADLEALIDEARELIP
ncbi:MAG TPA: hypothetical protein VH170_05870 [Chthoniobacterales bacterium]|jgi:hypothetical protein|nr:hypothetical protein [Chthoniobacterales bacterium]